ncbi:MFS transporter [Cupriavidus consociatus]|uniref:MFS transporter n=1 Tax=Cupriavidus consociatus TaxID=2821357 RepID=UPI001AEAA583|nr:MULTISPECIES: MFS transporter [unclassified Cupriavidus]MBP0623163.1 MFS transporter [Cupriavidus sp. LEh25]MDK2659857.1 MFS transporter [Cupriavidus sp. LEh21]
MHNIHLKKLTDEAPLSIFHWTVLTLCFVILVFDGYDLAVAGTALPAIMKEMGVEATTAGFMASSALFGMMFGGIILGTLADKIGRRLVLAICVSFFSIFTAAAGLTNDPYLFSVMRFLAGVGIGGAIPNVTAHMSEYAPTKVRGLMVTVMCCGYAIGSIIAALLAKQFIETHGWQSVFFAAGLPVLLIPLIMKYLPESLQFLIRQRDDARLRQIVRKMRPDIRLESLDEFGLPSQDKTEASSVRGLFQEDRAFSTVMIWAACITCLFMIYALSSWLVKLMTMAGYNLGSSLNFFLAYNAGALVGTVGGGWLADRLNIKWVTCAFFAVAAISLTLLGYGMQPLLLVAAVVGAATLGTQGLLYAFGGQFYPTSIRSTGLGFASGIGRIGAIAAPILIGFLVSMKLPLVQNFLSIAFVAVIGAIAVACISYRTSVGTHDYGAIKDVDFSEREAVNSARIRS